MKIEVHFFRGCPNHRATTALVHEVARELDVAAEVEEVEVRSLEDALRLRFLGSPTVRVDGVDIEPARRADTGFGLACRSYGNAGVPPRDLLVSALKEPAP